MLDPNTTAKIGLAAWELRDRLKTGTRKVRRRLNSGKFGIAIFGAGGTGKSTLGNLLDESFDPTIPPKAYKASIDTETYWLKSNDSQSLFVAPGQEGRQGYWYRVLDEVSQKRKVLLIHVVAAGYHATETKITDVEAYLQRCAQDEQRLFEDLLTSVRQFQMPLSMITVVAKQDLWYEHRDEVRAFYEDGKYAETVADLRGIKGAQNFQHEFVYTSLTVQNLKDKSGQIIAANTAGYDLALHTESLNYLFEVLERLMK